MARKNVSAWLGLAILAVPFFQAAGAAPSCLLPGRPASLVVFLTDESVYLCPLCGDRFLAAFRKFASQVGPGRIWVVVAGEKPRNQNEAATLKAATRKRIEAFLRSNGLACPVIDDLQGALHAPGQILPACIIFDAVKGIVQSFPVAGWESKKQL